MDEIRFKNLYDAFTSHIDYCNFIESYGEDFVTFENTNFDLLQTIYGGFMLTLLMDTYFKFEKDKPVKCSLLPDFVKILVSKIAKYNGKGYTIGELHYENEYTVLEKVRNKLAHGDFIIKEGYIVFEENKAEGKIKMSNFLDFISSFEVSHESYTLNKPYTKTFNKIGPNTRKIKTEKDFDLVCNNLYRVEFTDAPIFPRVRDSKYCEVREYFYDYIRNKLQFLTLEEIELTIEKYDHIFKQNGINMKCSIKKVSELDCYQGIKEKYMATNDVYKGTSKEMQMNYINNLSFIMEKGKYQNFDIRKGIQLNEAMLKILKEHPEYTLKRLILENLDLYNVYLFHFDDAILSSYLVGFNSIYEYGLEKGLTKKGCYNLVSIFDGISLDFSKLELSKLDDPNMFIEHDFSKYKTDVDEYEKEYMKKADKLINKAQRDYEEYQTKAKKQTEETDNKLTQKILDAIVDKEELKDKIKELRAFERTFNLDLYTRNINIIIHIRNAIAHGNVFVDSYASGIKDTEVIFRDYLDGNIVYEKKIKIRDFVTIFHSTNMQVIYEYITNNISDTSLVDDEYYEKLSVRLLLKQRRESGKKEFM